MANKDRREELRGAEEETFDLIAQVLTSKQWAELLKAPLEHAVAEGNRGLAQKLLGAGAECGDSLHAATRGGHAGIVNDLLENGASVSAKDASCGYLTPLHVAADEGKAEMMQLLLLHGADKDAWDNCGEDAPLHLAAQSNHVQAIDVLVEAGANIDAQDDGGSTSLHLAAGELSLEAVLALLKYGADVDAQDDAQNTPLHNAADAAAWSQGAAEVADSLLRAGADETILSKEGKAALDIVEEIMEGYQLAERFHRMRELLANAPIDRAWRRRGYLVLCRAHSDRIRQMQDISSAHAGMVETAQSSAKLGRTGASGSSGAVKASPVGERGGGDWATVMAMVLGLQEEGIFRTIVGYL